MVTSPVPETSHLSLSSSTTAFRPQIHSRLSALCTASVLLPLGVTRQCRLRKWRITLTTISSRPTSAGMFARALELSSASPQTGTTRPLDSRLAGMLTDCRVRSCARDGRTGKRYCCDYGDVCWTTTSPCASDGSTLDCGSGETTWCCLFKTCVLWLRFPSR